MTIDVIGTPQPQGSARAFNNPKGGRPIVTSDNKKLRPWRQDIRETVREHWGARPPHAGALCVRVVFRFQRPVGHFGKHGLLPSAPVAMTVRPDLDKLVRAVLDALKDAGVYRSDAQVVQLVDCRKRYCLPGEAPGVTIDLQPNIESERPAVTQLAMA